MMGLKPAVVMDLGELLIDVSEDADTSEEMDFSGWRGSVSRVGVDGPGTLTGTVTVQVSHSMEDTDEFGTTWRDLQVDGADVTIPSDGSVDLGPPYWKRLRFSSGSAEAADRRFRVKGREEGS